MRLQAGMTVILSGGADLPPGAYAVLSDPEEPTVRLGQLGEDQDGEVCMTERTFEVSREELKALSPAPWLDL